VRKHAFDGPSTTVSSSNPVTPTFREAKPFGEQVEGVSHWWHETYGSQGVVQTIVFLMRKMPCFELTVDGI
jgi:hypothetical protein